MSKNIAKMPLVSITFFMAMIKSILFFAITVWFIFNNVNEQQLFARILCNTFIGYQISWSGSLVGMLYGWVIGGIIGFSIGIIYNRIVDLRHQ